MSAWLKNASDIESDVSTSRSRLSIRAGARQSKNGATNSRHSGSQM